MIILNIIKEKFESEKHIDIYCVDFYIKKINTIIEVNG